MSSIFSNDYIRALLSAAPAAAPETRRPDAVAIAPDNRIPAGPRAESDALEGMAAESQKFFAAWKSWRGDQILPRRHQVQLTSIARLMPLLAVLEVRGPDRATFRLAGDDIEQAFGMRLTGRSFIKLADIDQQERRGELLWRQVSQPCAAIARHDLEYRSGRRETVEIASAPVLPDIEGAPVQIFAVISRIQKHAGFGASDAKDAIIRNFGRNLRFLDIGAGIPAQD